METAVPYCSIKSCDNAAEFSYIEYQLDASEGAKSTHEKFYLCDACRNKKIPDVIYKKDPKVIDK